MIVVPSGAEEDSYSNSNDRWRRRSFGLLGSSLVRDQCSVAEFWFTDGYIITILKYKYLHICTNIEIQILQQSCSSRVLVDWWFYHHKLPHSSAATSTIFYSSSSLQFESCKAVTFLILFKCVTPVLKAKLYLLKSSSWVKCKYYVMWCDVMTALTEEKVCVWLYKQVNLGY